MNNNAIKKSLASGISCLPRPDAAEISRLPVVRMDAHDDITQPGGQDLPQGIRGRAMPWVISCAAAALVILMFGAASFYWYFVDAESMISLDINPSFGVSINRMNRVLDIKGLNSDADSFLEGRAYKGWNVDKAVQSICYDVAAAGVLKPDAGAILLSVASPNDKRGMQLQDEITVYIEKALEQAEINSTLVQRRLPLENSDAQHRADHLHVSVGKLDLIDELVSQMATLDEEKLAAMSIFELVELAKQYGLTLEGVHHPQTAHNTTHNAASSTAGTSRQHQNQSHHTVSSSSTAPAASVAVSPSKTTAAPRTEPASQYVPPVEQDTDLDEDDWDDDDITDDQDLDDDEDYDDDDDYDDYDDDDYEGNGRHNRGSHENSHDRGHR